MSGSAYLVVGGYAHYVIAEAARVIRAGEGEDCDGDIFDERLAAMYICLALSDAVRQLAYHADGDATLDPAEWADSMRVIRDWAEYGITHAERKINETEATP